MADPLSIAASITGLVALTDSVASGCFRCYRAVKDAKVELEMLLGEVRGLSGILHNLSVLASSLEDEQFDQTMKAHHLHACRQTLLKMDKRLSKAKAKSEGSKITASAWQLKWPFTSAETKELQAEIARHKETINLALSVDSMNALLRSLSRSYELEAKVDVIDKAIKKTFEVNTRIEVDSERKKVLDFFMPANPQSNLETSLQLRHPLTGLWLTESPAFLHWLEAPNSKLWLSGIPGAGKTVLAGAIAEEILNQQRPSVAAAFFFCDYKNEASQLSVNVLSTLGHQLARQGTEAFELLATYYRELHPHTRLPKKPTRTGLLNLIGDMTDTFEKVFIVVDGLDECGSGTDDVVDALANLVDLNTNVSLALLSRDERNIRDKLEDGFTHIQIAAHTEDIQLYVGAEIEMRMKSKKLRIKSQSLKEEIINTLVNGAQGMFRWVSCQIDYLCELPTDGARRDALKELPPDLNATYERLLERVNKTHHEARRIVVDALGLIAFASPRLTIEELCEAVSISDSTTRLSEDNIVDESEISRLCSSLIRKDNSGERFEFAHFTVEEFLGGSYITTMASLERYHISQEKTTLALTLKSLRFLNLPQFGRKPGTDAKTEIEHIGSRNLQHPFYEYASIYWPIHAQKHAENHSFIQLAEELFDCPKRPTFLEWSVEICRHYIPHDDDDYDWCKREPDGSDDVSITQLVMAINRPDFTPLHLAAALGQWTICEFLLDSRSQINTRSQVGTPLHCALCGPVLFAALEAYEVDMVSFHWAYVRSSASMCFMRKELEKTMQLRTVRLLLDRGASPSICLSSSYPILSGFSFALLADMWLGYPRNLAEVLRDNSDLDESFLDILRRALLTWTSDMRSFSLLFMDDEERASYQDIFKVILASIVPPISPGSCLAETRSTVLDICKLLGADFNLDVSPDSQNSSNSATGPGDATSPGNAAVIAVRDNDVETLRKLKSTFDLQSAVTVDGEDTTLLHHACSLQSLDALEFLLESGCDPDVTDQDGLSPILLCDEDGMVDILRALLKHNASDKATDEDGETLYHLAARLDSRAILRALLDLSGSCSESLRAKSSFGRTALAEAIDSCSEEAALLLIRYCRDDMTCYESGLPTFRAAATIGSERMLSTLVEVGVSPDPRHADGSNPLHHLGPQATPRCVLILKSSYDAYIPDSHGRTPLERILFSALELEEPTILSIDTIKELIPVGGFSSQQLNFFEYFCTVLLPMYLGREAAQTVRDWMGEVCELLSQSGATSISEGTKPASDILFEAVLHPSTRVRPEDAKIISALARATDYPGTIQRKPYATALLQLAVRIGSSDLIDDLLDAGVNVHERVDGLSALEEACQPGSMCGAANFTKLLAHAETPKLDELNVERDFMGLTHFLVIDSIRERNDKLRQLLQHGANPNLIRNGVPVVMYHIWQRSSAASIFLEYGLDVSKADYNGWDSVLLACYYGDLKFLVQVHSTEDDVVWNRKCTLLRRTANEVKGCSALHLAAFSGQNEVLKFCREKGLLTDMDSATDDLKTPLHMAAMGGCADTIQFLVDRGASITAKTTQGHLPLHLAIQFQRLGCVELLLKLGSPHEPDFRGLTSLMQAQRTGNAELVRILKKHIAQNYPRESFGSKVDQRLASRIMQEAIYRGDLDACKTVCAGGFDFSEALPVCHRCTPLALAMALGKIEIVDWLMMKDTQKSIPCLMHAPRPWLSGGNGVLSSTGLDYTLVHLACTKNGYKDHLRTLLSHHLRNGISWLDSASGVSPLHVALGYKNDEALRIVLSHVSDNIILYANITKDRENASLGIDGVLDRIANQVSHIGGFLAGTPLHIAVRLNNIPAAAILLRHGAKADMPDDMGTTPLHGAAILGLSGMLRLLLRSGAHTEIRDRSGSTPLLSSAAHANLDMTKLLISLGADIKAKTYFQCNILHLASWNIRQPQVFVYLLQQGLDPELENDDGLCATATAMANPRLRTFILNTEHVLKVREMPFNVALFPEDRMKNLFSVMKALARRRGVPNSLINHHPARGRSPLCYAASLGNLDGLEALLKMGSDIEFEGSPEGTALLSACVAGQYECVRFLVRRGAQISCKVATVDRSSLSAARRFPDIVDWLLVGRFTDQRKIGWSTSGGDGAGKGSFRWCGPKKVPLPLVGIYRRLWGESLLDYVSRLHRVKLEMRHKVFPGPSLNYFEYLD